MKKFIMFLGAVVMAAAVLSCGKDSPSDPKPDIGGGVAPTSITISPTSISAAQAGESINVTFTSPSRPVISSLPGWITVTDGTFNNYKITVKLNIAANDTYETRTANLTVTATGATSVTYTVSQAGKTVVPDPVLPDNAATQLSTTLGLGWNMGNHFDAYYNGDWAGDKEGYPDELVWQGDNGHLASQATFNGVKAAGFTSVRIPVSWLKMIGEAPDYKIDETWMNRVYEVVGFAHNAGLNVIINTHHDENHGVNNTYQWLDIKNAALNSDLNNTIKAKITAVWTQIANKFKDCGDWLIMESFNELNDGGWGWSDAFRADPTKQCGILNEWNKVFVDAVRATGGNNATRWLGIPTYAANPTFVDYLTLPDDAANKLMVSVHFYDPSSYTIGDEQYSDWGHTGAAGKKAAEGEDHVKEVFNKLYTKYVANNIPVYIGEFGCSMRKQSDARAWAFYLYYMEYVVKAAKVFGMPCYLWDNGSEGDGKEKHGYIHHGTGAVIGNAQEVVNVMKKARFTTDATYTLQSIYDSAPTFSK